MNKYVIAALMAATTAQENTPVDTTTTDTTNWNTTDTTNWNTTMIDTTMSADNSTDWMNTSPMCSDVVGADTDLTLFRADWYSYYYGYWSNDWYDYYEGKYMAKVNATNDIADMFNCTLGSANTTDLWSDSSMNSTDSWNATAWDDSWNATAWDDSWNSTMDNSWNTTMTDSNSSDWSSSWDDNNYYYAGYNGDYTYNYAGYREDNYNSDDSSTYGVSIPDVVEFKMIESGDGKIQ